MSAAHRLSSSSLVASAIIAPKRRRAQCRAMRAIASALEPLERRLCLSVSFSGPVSWPTDESPVSVAVGDFNGDGKQDLATANDSFSSDTVSILLGSGSGAFAAPMNFVAGHRPQFVTIGDFNKDGNQDVVVTNDSTTVSVLLGNGSGGLSAPTPFPVGTAPRSVAVGDYDGDGNQDLAVANQGTDNVSILLGNGAGGFGSATNFLVGENPNSIAVGDFNGDGHPDLAVANGGSEFVTVLIGDGTGNFGSAPFASHFPDSVAVGDFNGDGKQDLVTGNGDLVNVSILLGNGIGGFAVPLTFDVHGTARSVAVADFDGDGNQDLAAAIDDGAVIPAGGVDILLGDGAGNLGAADFFAGNARPLRSVAIGDFNGDGSPDLAAPNVSINHVGIFLNTTLSTPELTNLTVTSSVLENGIATLSGDISHSIAGHSFTLTVDWGDGSTPEEFVYPVGTTSFSETHQYLDDDPTGTASDPVVIDLTLTDDAGGSTTGSANLTVENVPPEVTLGAASAVRGVPLALAGGFTEVGTLDTHEVQWDFGDGTVIAFHSTTDPGALTPTHMYAANGTYIVTMTVRDDDTGTTPETTSVFVSAVALTPDPSDATRNILVVGGTAGGDNIRFNRVGQTTTIDAFIGTQYLGRFSPTARLVVFAGAGNDTVTVDKNISLPAILLGGAGDDILNGGSGRDLLIGGTGADRVSGGGDDDIHIGGTTAHDDNLLGLGSILNEWTRSLSLANRVNNLMTAGGLSGGFALNASTVFDDGASDVLTGEAGKDWFLFGNGDVLVDLSRTEAATFT